MIRLTALLLLLPMAALAGWDADLLKARDRQDRPALEKMIGGLQAAADKAPNDAEAHYRVALADSYLGEICLELKDKGGAERAAEAGARAAQAAIQLKPKNAEYYRVLATLCGQAIPAVNLLSQLTYGKRAKEAIDKAMALNPNSALVHEARGVGNYYLPQQLGGGAELAMTDFRKAIELDPKLADSYLWLALCLRKLHRNGEARQALQHAIDLDPQRVWLKEQLEKTPAQ